MESMNKLFIYVFAVLACAGIFSCNENEDMKKIFSFSGIKELDLSLLESQESATGYFTLDASGKCMVSSDRMWVTFSVERDGEYSHDIVCDGNIDTVYVKVSNDARDFADATAVVVIVADGEKYPVGSITRQAKSYEFSLMTEDNSVAEMIGINDKATAWFSFSANFECGIIDYPEWLMEPVLENGGYRFTVVEDYVPMAQEGVVVVGNSSLTRKYELPVSYEGMNPETIRIEGDTPWGWVVSLDGQEFKKDESSMTDDSENIVIVGNLNMNIICRDYSYETVFVENIAGTLQLKEGDEAWIKAVRDGNDPKAVKVTVDEYEIKSSRSGYLFAVPVALYGRFMEKLSSTTSAETFIDEYEKYVLVEVVQKDSGFKVALVENGVETDIPCESDEDADYYIKLNGEYTITDIMACDVELGKSYVINTRLTVDDCGWSDDNAYYALHDINGVEIRERLWKLKVVAGDDGYFRINVTVPGSWDDELDRNVVLRLYTPDVVNIKALVLRVQE